MQQYSPEEIPEGEVYQARISALTVQEELRADAPGPEREQPELQLRQAAADGEAGDLHRKGIQNANTGLQDLVQ